MLEPYKRVTNAIVGLVNRAEGGNTRAVATLASKQVQNAFLQAAQRCARSGFVLGTLSEASLRLTRSRYLTLAGGTSLTEAGVEDIAILELKGGAALNGVTPPLHPEIHSLVYSRTEHDALFLCQPAYAMFWLTSGRALDFSILPALERQVGRISICQQPDLEGALPASDLVLIIGQGVLSLGRSLDDALDRVEALEWICRQNQLAGSARIERPSNGQAV
jgi:ribulose-5-phosphate 4-epimerase/fuculose-1-phosphate aldolase